MHTMGTMDDNGSSTWVLSLPAILRDVDGVLVSWFRVVQLWLLQTFGKWIKEQNICHLTAFHIKCLWGESPNIQTWPGNLQEMPTIALAVSNTPFLSLASQATWSTEGQRPRQTAVCSSKGFGDKNQRPSPLACRTVHEPPFQLISPLPHLPRWVFCHNLDDYVYWLLFPQFRWEVNHFWNLIWNITNIFLQKR